MDRDSLPVKELQLGHVMKLFDIVDKVTAAAGTRFYRHLLKTFNDFKVSSSCSSTNSPSSVEVYGPTDQLIAGSKHSKHADRVKAYRYVAAAVFPPPSSSSPLIQLLMMVINNIIMFSLFYHSAAVVLLLVNCVSVAFSPALHHAVKPHWPRSARCSRSASSISKRS